MSKALVTGASSGIGEAFARLLSKRGWEVLLVARRAERLAEVAELCGERAEIMVADLATHAGIASVVERSRNVDLLINNAGFGTFGDFADLDLNREIEELHVHLQATMELCHATLPAMVARGSGGIINVSSIVGFVPSPGGATYSACKAFLTSFTQSLHEQYRTRGVKIMALCPGLTRTEFGTAATGIGGTGSRPWPLYMNAERCARLALRAHRMGRVVYVTGWINKFAELIGRPLPPFITRKIAKLWS